MNEAMNEDQVEREETLETLENEDEQECIDSTVDEGMFRCVLKGFTIICVSSTGSSQMCIDVV